MLSEHSEPGYFIELADSLESTLRHMTWERAQALSREVLDFFAEVAPESLPALSGFHLETPGQAGCFPPCLSTLEPVEEGPVKEAVERINREKGLCLRLSWTSLLEGKPASREDYVEDIRDALRLPEFDISLPKQILEHRQRLMDGAFARFKSWEEFDNSQIGQRWVNTRAERWQKALEELDSDVRAVGRYLLDTAVPEAVAREELSGWCLLSLSLRHDASERLLDLLESGVRYLYEKFQYCLELVRLTGPTQGLVERLERHVEEARLAYTPEAVEAMEALVREAKGPFFR